MTHQDPYEAIGSPLRVNHPTQPKTQVERWREERDANIKAINDCGCAGYIGVCYKNGTDNCDERLMKIIQLEELIQADHEKNKTYLNRHPTGTFADDVTDGSTYFASTDNWGTTLLDKIKLLWKKH